MEENEFWLQFGMGRRPTYTDNRSKAELKEHNRKVYLKRKVNGKQQEYSTQLQLARKTDVLTHYGNGKLACVRCGFTDIRALSLDHIDGKGWAATKRAQTLYANLRKEGYPNGYQTLCMNCQWIKRAENYEHRLY